MHKFQTLTPVKFLIMKSFSINFILLSLIPGYFCSDKTEYPEPKRPKLSCSSSAEYKSDGLGYGDYEDSLIKSRFVDYERDRDELTASSSSSRNVRTPDQIKQVACDFDDSPFSVESNSSLPRSLKEEYQELCGSPPGGVGIKIGTLDIESDDNNSVRELMHNSADEDEGDGDGDNLDW